jgi:hypothetical protein
MGAASERRGKAAGHRAIREPVDANASLKIITLRSKNNKNPESVRPGKRRMAVCRDRSHVHSIESGISRVGRIVVEYTDRLVRHPGLINQWIHWRINPFLHPLNASIRRQKTIRKADGSII